MPNVSQEPGQCALTQNCRLHVLSILCHRWYSRPCVAKQIDNLGSSELNQNPRWVEFRTIQAVKLTSGGSDHHHEPSQVTCFSLEKKHLSFRQSVFSCGYLLSEGMEGQPGTCYQGFPVGSSFTPAKYPEPLLLPLLSLLYSDFFSPSPGCRKHAFYLRVQGRWAGAAS